MQRYQLGLIIAALESKGYEVFKHGDYNLNIVAVRDTSTPNADTFNDVLCVFYRSAGKWHMHQFRMTTDPGVYYRKNPLHEEGTAQLAPGQYRSAYKLAKHKGKYPALVQVRAVNFYRDNDLDTALNQSGEIHSGLIGANIHRANELIESEQVGQHSAGCQVLANPHEYALFIALCNLSSKTYGDKFTYTLLTDTQVKEALKHA